MRGQKSFKTHHPGSTTARKIQLGALQNYLHDDCDVFAPGLLHSELFLFIYLFFKHAEPRVLLQFFQDSVCLTLLKNPKTNAIHEPPPKLKTSAWAISVIFAL